MLFLKSLQKNKTVVGTFSSNYLLVNVNLSYYFKFCL